MKGLRTGLLLVTVLLPLGVLAQFTTNVNNFPGPPGPKRGTIAVSLPEFCKSAVITVDSSIRDSSLALVSWSVSGLEKPRWIDEVQETMGLQRGDTILATERFLGQQLYCSCTLDRKYLQAVNCAPASDTCGAVTLSLTYVDRPQLPWRKRVFGFFSRKEESPCGLRGLQALIGGNEVLFRSDWKRE